jgi:hypothetical protein
MFAPLARANFTNSKRKDTLFVSIQGIIVLQKDDHPSISRCPPCPHTGVQDLPVLYIGGGGFAF